MILVAGATGMLGSEICLKLAQRGESVRALVRATSSPDKVDLLRRSRVELFLGDLKDPASLASACRGVDAVVSTASSTFSRQPGDSIESVDDAGQLNLVAAARNAAVSRFVFVSFRRPASLSFPLGDAKAHVEQALRNLNFTVIQASWFMESWLSPALGFDYPNAAVRIYGSGTNPISWVSFRDVAEMCVLALRHPDAGHRTIEFGGPAALSPLEVVALFERVAARPFRIEHIPEEALRAQFEQATDSLQKSFSALMLGYASGDAIDMTGVREEFSIALTSVNQFAHSQLAPATSRA
jgi:uncharacterized protein YbjT (DUF2867 family)